MNGWCVGEGGDFVVSVGIWGCFDEIVDFGYDLLWYCGKGWCYSDCMDSWYYGG